VEECVTADLGNRQCDPIFPFLCQLRGEVTTNF